MPLIQALFVKYRKQCLHSGFKVNHSNLLLRASRNIENKMHIMISLTGKTACYLELKIKNTLKKES